MKSDKTFLLCIILFTLYFFHSSSQQNVKTLNLDEGDICRRGKGSEADYVCKTESECELSIKSIKSQNFLSNLKICAYYENQQTIVCCPSSVEERVNNSFTADEMCLEYSTLTYENPDEDTSKRIGDEQNDNNAVFGGEIAEEQEFPHMALLGYHIKGRNEMFWLCGGSIISKRWVLSAGFCHQHRINSTTVIWARLGVSNINRLTGKYYRVQQSIPHPDFDLPSRYDDIALFRLEVEVQFSQFIKPICLNTNQLSNPNSLIATGWGRTSTGKPPMGDLLKIYLNIIPTNQCNIRYFLNNRNQLEFGIKSDSMMCAAPANGKQDTCGGDTGGPLQVKNVNNPNMYTQYGIISFGISAKTCSAKNAYVVYTRVSKYISWIEKIVWPKREVQ